MTDRRDELADEEAEAAAAEAGAIGGRVTRDLDADVDSDEAMRPVYEGGGGEEEGFELAESELIEHASLGPANEVHVREEIDRETEEVDPATYGEADEVDVTEVTRDPNADPDDDQGRDPHSAHDR